MSIDDPKARSTYYDMYGENIQPYFERDGLDSLDDLLFKIDSGQISSSSSGETEHEPYTLSARDALHLMRVRGDYNLKEILNLTKAADDDDTATRTVRREPASDSEEFVNYLLATKKQVNAGISNRDMHLTVHGTLNKAIDWKLRKLNAL